MSALIVDHKNVGAAFRRLSVPTAVQMLGDQLLGVVDTIAIGSLGAVALAGATAANAAFMALLYALAGLLAGTTIIAAQRVGADDVDGYARTVRAGAVVPLLGAVACFALSVPLADPVVHAMVGNLASAHASAQYFVLRCASMIPIMISSVLVAGLGAAGNRRLGVIVLLIINLVHIPLLLVLALGWWTHHPFGIAGAGLSSLLSETIAAIYALIYVARRPVYRIFSSLTVSLKLAVETARLGTPEAIFLLGVMLPDVVIIALLAPLGPMIVSAFRALNVVSDLTFVIPAPLQTAAQTVIGQRLGARDREGALWFLHRAQRVALIVTTATGAIAAALAWPLAYAFTLNAAVAGIAALPLALHMATLPVKGWSMVSLAPIRASGDTRFSMLVGIVCSVLVIPFAWIGIERLQLALYSVPLGWIAAWSVRALLTRQRLRAGTWLERAPLAA
jgi:putative MATE family efflux protein